MHNPRTKAMGLLKMGKISLSKANDDEAKNLLALYKVVATKNVTFLKDELQDVKDSVGLLLNARLNDCLATSDLGVVVAVDLDANDLGLEISKRIRFLLEKYEVRICVLSISYDHSLSPWQLSFFLRCHFSADRFKEFDLEIIFQNERYCEVH